jgi:hypothetical protein
MGQMHGKILAVTDDGIKHDGGGSGRDRSRSAGQPRYRGD